MATYVLVHGGFHGGWCWESMLPFLEGASHTVYAPSLPGLGSRASELSPEVGLDTHIQDVVRLLSDKDLHRVILVGHSYGGMVITGVADAVPERIVHLVYLDTFVPRDGEAMGGWFGYDYGRYPQWREPPRTAAPSWGGFYGARGWWDDEAARRRGRRVDPDYPWGGRNLN